MRSITEINLFSSSLSQGREGAQIFIYWVPTRARILYGAGDNSRLHETHGLLGETHNKLTSKHTVTNWKKNYEGNRDNTVTDDNGDGPSSIRARKAHLRRKYLSWNLRVRRVSHGTRGHGDLVCSQSWQEAEAAGAKRTTRRRPRGCWGCWQMRPDRGSPCRSLCTVQPLRSY